MQKKEPDTFCPTSQLEWRNWLIKNHITEQSVWLVMYRKKSNMPSIEWSVAVDEALCFGWIDSKRVSVDDEKFIQFYCKRKPKSNWSKINKEKVERLIAEGLMVEAGLKCIEIAKQNGSWNTLDAVEELIVPEDLEQAFKRNKGSKDFFLSLSKSVRKIMLYWIVSAKRPETREARVNEVASKAAQKLKPKQF